MLQTGQLLASNRKALLLCFDARSPLRRDPYFLGPRRRPGPDSHRLAVVCLSLGWFSSYLLSSVGDCAPEILDAPGSLDSHQWTCTLLATIDPFAPMVPVTLTLAPDWRLDALAPALPWR